MNRLHDLSTALRSLDAADEHVDPASARARLDLARILSIDPSPALQQEPGVRSSARRDLRTESRRTAARVAVAVGVLSAVTVGLVVLPSLSGGDRAFASWTAEPRGLSAQERQDASAACRDQQEHGAGSGYGKELRAADPAIVERRGVWTTVVLAAADGFSAMCITDESRRLFSQGMVGSVGTPSDFVTPAPGDLNATDLGVGTMGARSLSLAAGMAGSDVVGVTYQSRSRGVVAATVSRGRFALWLPGDELENASTEGMQVNVTYRDGTTATRTLTL